MTSNNLDRSLDAVIVGAGFAGIYMLHRLKNMGLRAKVFESAGGIGGTWYWNRYPGARCDVTSLEYSYSFSEELQQEWSWTERYAGQAEILQYLEHVVERFQLADDIILNTRVSETSFDEKTLRWSVTSSSGIYNAKYCVMATGPLSTTNSPDFPGLSSYEGETYHTGTWPHEDINFAGRTVGIIGTGSSGIQSTPVIAEQAEHLYVFQRTPNFSVPAGNHALSAADQNDIKADYAGFREQQRKLPAACHHLPRRESALDASPEKREQIYDDYWKKGGLSFLGAFNDLLTKPDANETAANFIRDKIRQIVKNPAIAEKLCPDHLFGCKRPCSDTGYYESFNRSNVSLIDVAETPIETFTNKGIKVSDNEIKLDSVIFATGFDAMTGTLEKIKIVGRNAVTLTEAWSAGPCSYLGLSVVGFPNLFIMTGPGSPSVLANMVTGAEQHAEWISDCIKFIEDNDLSTIEATEKAQNDWVEHVNTVADTTIYPTCNSWYLGANIPNKPRIFMPYIGGFQRYERRCLEIQSEGYPGFMLA